jgi:DNA primase large subunit
MDNRDPKKMYRILIGEDLKEIILVKLIMQATEDYIETVSEKARILVEPSPILINLADRLNDVLSESSSSYGGSGGFSDGEASPYNQEAFPPCVRSAIDGIKSGGRNDGIVLFLTPFLSYARLFPDIFKQNVSVKVSDRDPNLEVVQNEVLPLIYLAADRCHPPLFEDQPQEKININAKLGFGMHDTLKPGNEGETKWYTPMSCEKIKLHLPHLCRPDQDCKKIGNPLIYYNRKSYLLKQHGSSYNEDSEGIDSHD